MAVGLCCHVVWSRSVCLPRLCLVSFKTSKRAQTFSPPDRPTVLVFLYETRNSGGNPP